ncbi:MAG: hypothetical protein ABFD18_04125 [Syntrophomonas sp.]
MNSCCHHRNWNEFREREMHDCPDDGDLLVLESSIPRNHQKDVSPNIKSIILKFRNGLDWSNCIEVDMWQGTNRVPIRFKEIRDGCSGLRTIKVTPINSLVGGVVFKVRIKAFFVDRCGDSIKKIAMISFTTGCK